MSSDFSSILLVLLCWQETVAFVLSTSSETWSSAAVPKRLYSGRSEAASAVHGGFITNAILPGKTQASWLSWTGIDSESKVDQKQVISLTPRP